MTLRWSNKDLRYMLIKQYGTEILNSIDIPMNSITWKFNIAVFHAQKSQEVLYDVLPTEPFEQIKALFENIFDGNSEKNKAITKAQVAAEAHLIAYIQMMHSIHDSLGQVIYYSIIKNQDEKYRIKERYISLKTVHDKLKTLSTEKPEYLTIERHVKNFLNSRYFKYLDAINNNIKHYGLVGISSHVSCDDWSKGVHDFVIQEFSHNGNLIPSKRASKFVNFERDMLFKRIIVIGIALNKAVLCTT